jgi:hypothetical protein
VAAGSASGSVTTSGSVTGGSMVGGLLRILGSVPLVLSPTTLTAGFTEAAVIGL